MQRSCGDSGRATAREMLRVGNAHLQKIVPDASNKGIPPHVIDLAEIMQSFKRWSSKKSVKIPFPGNAFATRKPPDPSPILPYALQNVQLLHSRMHKFCYTQIFLSKFPLALMSSDCSCGREGQPDTTENKGGSGDSSHRQCKRQRS